ncbi:hypothetical protein L915_15302 [Phytophthora nicotianae]|uniref:Uncharacterized protein n=2 Tax=Phytophthora nicotianae TaxID=4792 RepID=W2MQJ7_PHYNI|nr:hypothetical protein L915_15302 [Phytophthora nicotianae]ETL32171.1 hypothetical protein L916_15193 [Phytophthora nicotianae]ETM38565.1 hypothetical protein L914_15159 [Phytophthora nicotianae]
MKLKQKAVTTTTTTPVKETPSMKRPRSLLDTTTTQYSTSTKKYKMSPRDVCVVDELSDVTVASCVDPLWLLEDICSNKDDLVLLDALDSVELEELDWDAVISPVDVSSNDSDTNSDIRINNVDVDLDFCFELDGAAPTDVLTDADVSVILGDLEITQVILDCEFDVRLEDVAIISTDVDTPLFV